MSFRKSEMLVVNMILLPYVRNMVQIYVQINDLFYFSTVLISLDRIKAESEVGSRESEVGRRKSGAGNWKLGIGETEDGTGET